MMMTPGRDVFAELRRFVRHDIALPVRIRVGGVIVSATTQNLSGGGAKLSFQPALAPVLQSGDLVLSLDEFGALPAGLRWMGTATCGISFEINDARKRAMADRLAVLYG